MTSAAKAKGDRAEREVAALYRDHLGLDVRRTLAGHGDAWLAQQQAEVAS
jgi:hypothetical protein